MSLKQLICQLLLLLLAYTPFAVWAQTLEPELSKLNEQLVSRLREKRPEWTHDTVAPLVAPGSKPRNTIAIHFWRAKKCLTANYDGVAGPEVVPVACSVKVSIYIFPAPEKAQADLKNFVAREQQMVKWKPTALDVGDEGYVWGRDNVAFIKGRFMFFLSTDLLDDPRMHLDSFSTGLEITEEFAKDVAAAVPGD